MSASPPVPSSPSNATTSRAGLLSPTDKTKLDGVAAGATATPLSGATPQDVGTATGGVSGNASRADHVHAHGTQASDGTLHAVAIASGAAGFMSGTDKAKLDGLPTSAVPTSLTLTAGAGLTGLGDLTSNRTVNVGANADGSITVNADDIQVGILATDAQHGARGGGTQHAGATATAAGFMSAIDKTKADAQGSRLVRVGWAWIKGSDGTKLAGSANVTTGRTSTGVYTATLTDGATYSVAQPSYLTSAPSNPYYVQAIATSSTVATVETISRTGAAADQDVLVFLLADTGAPSALSEIGWVWVKGADGTKLAGSPNLLPARSSTGTYTVTLVGGATYSVAVTTLIRSGAGTAGRLLAANTTSSTVLALFSNDTGGTLIDTDFLVRFYV